MDENVDAIIRIDEGDGDVMQMRKYVTGKRQSPSGGDFIYDDEIQCYFQKTEGNLWKPVTTTRCCRGTELFNDVVDDMVEAMMVFEFLVTLSFLYDTIL